MNEELKTAILLIRDYCQNKECDECEIKKDIGCVECKVDFPHKWGY